MIMSSDSGTLPFFGDERRFLEGAVRYRIRPEEVSASYFARTVVKGFLDKVEAGIDVPTYPQFRDMNDMFLQMLGGIEKGEEGYVETDCLSLKMNRAQIPEVAAIRANSKQIREKTGQPFRARVCITGPYTLSSLFAYRDKQIFQRLGTLISRIIETNLFNEKHGGVELVTLDEPVFGLQDDALIDYGSEGRKNLRRAWQSILEKANSKGVRRALHLHSTADELFWEVDALDVIESHVDDPIYEMKKTLRQLESTDKFLKASICIVNFDELIKSRIIASLEKETSESVLNQRIAEVWTSIKSGTINPTAFVEDTELMKKRLTQIVDRFGVERIPYAGPECGLRGFPSYGSAMECLRRVSTTIENA